MRRLFIFLIAFLLIVSISATVQAGAPKQVADEALALLEDMEPEERIGQLFVVPFRGASLSSDSPIIQLLRERHISAVILQIGNDNFVAAPETLPALQTLITELQSASMDFGGQDENGAPLTQESAQVDIPLLVAINQEGNGAPYSSLLSGLTPQSSPMAIGATWEPNAARIMGRISGKELSALGINLLLGPSLDVLKDPRFGGPSDLGVRTFGGDPYWVSEMGSAYIEGLHQGSSGRMAVMPKHFPGLGGIDRPPEDEVSTVRKSLTELQQIDLAPFFSVTGAPPGDADVIADGLLSSHIRYQGFQGNIRATTRPVSLDPDALAQVLALDSLTIWREGGGVIVSDALGSQALRRFYASADTTFIGHLVARDAFLAGNDLLILAGFASPEDPDGLEAIESTLAFFTQKYREDPVFAQQVDESVLRILSLKLRLYQNDFSSENILPDPNDLEDIGGDANLSFNVARSAATLINPQADEVRERVGGPPQIGDRIVFFTDMRLRRQCSNCPLIPEIAVDAFEQNVLRLYGPQAAGQVGGWNLTSLSMVDLANYLGVPLSAPSGLPLTPVEDVETAIQAADWLVFLTLNQSSQIPGSDSLRLFLDQRAALANDKRMVVFALDVPYVLDATEISKIDLYYALYSKSRPYIEVAARLLFQEIAAQGASPVSVPGVGYDLIEATSPDPRQVISLSIPPREGEDEAEPTPEGFFVNDEVVVETGVIHDSNGNVVPDGTPVTFLFSYGSESIPLTLDAFTQDGIGRSVFTLDRLGTLTIRAESDPARTSDLVQIRIQEGESAVVTVLTPELPATETPVPTETIPPILPTEEALIEDDHGNDQGRANGLHFGDLAFGLLGISMAAAFSLFGLSRWVPHLHQNMLLRFALLNAAGGLLAYNYLALGFPGSELLIQVFRGFSGLIVGLSGALVGLALGWTWSALRR